jgi:hypothetical protein
MVGRGMTNMMKGSAKRMKSPKSNKMMMTTMMMMGKMVRSTKAIVSVENMTHLIPLSCFFV